MNGIYCRSMARILLLALVIGVMAIQPSPAASGTPAAVGGSTAQALEQLGRWHRGPVYASAVSGDHVFFGSGGAIRVLGTDEDAASWREVASMAALICSAVIIEWNRS